ncbi:MAG: protein kinase [candidate division Zixibacteria bacterium]|nr:protein kinase [candidate division Zixibacteria bacterium]
MTNSDDDKTQTHLVLTKGTMVAHYQIIEKIGAGGMGEVYLAGDTKLQRQVALKFLPPHLCQDKDCRTRFTREAQAAAKLDHPNIVTIYEVGEHQGQPFFAMQHVEGKSLGDAIKDEKFDLDKVIELAGQICEGLQKAHEAGIIHRDVKPSSIVIDADGRPKLLDFGLASVVGAEHLTRTGSTIGTIGYMSPEQIEGKETDARSDLFSFGCVMHEMITGHPPFKRDDQTATLKAVLQDTPEPLARYKADVPDNFQLVVSKLLEKDPALRYQSAAGVVADLKRLAVTSTEPEAKPKRKSWKSLLNKFWFGCIIGITFYVVSEYVMPLLQDAPSECKMLAVLPFENLGDPEDEYFADGITDEITTNLAKLSGLGVISRTSAMRYKDTNKSVREIGKELGVDYVVEGTIRWDKTGDENRVRINPQLIQVDGDVHLWADRYDTVLTDIFEVQSGIASEVAAAMDITLLQSEQEALSRERTIDPQAYDFYLRGKKYYGPERYFSADYVLGERMFLRAIELQPDFALAYAELSSLHTDIYWNKADPDISRLDTALEYLRFAVELAPDLPETHLAVGWYYYHGRKDYDSALAAFEQVLRQQPNNALAVASIAWVKRRQGDFDLAVEAMRRAIKLDPWNPWYQFELGMTLVKSRRFGEAVAHFDETIEMQPDNLWAYLMKGFAVFNHTGDYKQTHAVIETALTVNDRSPQLTFTEIYYNMCFEQYDHALSLLAESKPGDVYLYPDQDSAQYYFIKGTVFHISNRPELARPCFDSARVMLERLINSTPNIANYHNSLAKVYAGLGMKASAIKSAKRAIELEPVAADAMSGPDHLICLVIVYAQVGELDSALAILEQLSEIPSDLSVHMLRLSPEFAPLRDDPRFKTLIEKYNTPN